MGTAAGSGMEALRPLELGELLDRTFSLYRRFFLTFVMIAAVPYVLMFLAGQVLGYTAVGVGARRAVPTFTVLFLIGALLMFLLYISAAAAAQAAGFFAVSEAYLGRPTTFADAYRQARGKLAVLIGTTIYVGLAVGAGFLLLIIPGLILVCRASVAIPAAIFEDLGPRAALSRSMELTKGFAWRAAAILGLTMIVAFVAGFLIQFPIQIVSFVVKNTPAAAVWNSLGEIGNLVSQCVAGPIAFIATTLFYYDLRVRKEGFDLERLLVSIGGGSAQPAGLTPGPLGSIR